MSIGNEYIDMVKLEQMSILTDKIEASMRDNAVILVTINCEEDIMCHKCIYKCSEYKLNWASTRSAMPSPPCSIIDKRHGTSAFYVGLNIFKVFICMGNPHNIDIFNREVSSAMADLIRTVSNAEISYDSINDVHI